MNDNKWEIQAPTEKNSYTRKEVVDVLKKFTKEADFIDFSKEYGLSGWVELDKWIENEL